jgi:hypothetical protein
MIWRRPLFWLVLCSLLGNAVGIYVLAKHFYDVHESFFNPPPTREQMMTGYLTSKNPDKAILFIGTSLTIVKFITSNIWTFIPNF